MWPSSSVPGPTLGAPRGRPHGQRSWGPCRRSRRRRAARATTGRDGQHGACPHCLVHTVLHTSADIRRARPSTGSSEEWRVSVESTVGVTPGVAPPPQPEPELVQLLTPEGERVSHPDYAIDLADEEYRGLYRDMVLVRRLDTEAVALQRQGELGLWASLLGQEAAQVGSARALAPQDFAFPTYRDHGVSWCRGVDPLEVLGLFRGVNQGGWDPYRYNCQLYTIVIGAQTLHATGYAMGIQRDGGVGTGDPTRDSAVIAYFGDGATAEGDVSEAFVFAGVNNAPVVFFCQNNQYAISEPNERQL